MLRDQPTGSQPSSCAAPPNLWPGFSEVFQRSESTPVGLQYRFDNVPSEECARKDPSHIDFSQPGLLDQRPLIPRFSTGDWPYQWSVRVPLSGMQAPGSAEVWPFVRVSRCLTRRVAMLYLSRPQLRDELGPVLIQYQGSDSLISSQNSLFDQTLLRR